MKVVLDTNIAVSALLNPHGPSAQIVGMALSGDLTLCCDLRILAEYREVLSRAKLNFELTAVEDFLHFIENDSCWVIARRTKHKFTDQEDAKFFETAAIAQADYLITGNLKHFPKSPQIVSPARFLEIYRNSIA